MKHPFALRVIMESLDRARYGNTKNELGLIKWEFMLSKNEYKKFWLKQSQANRIARTLCTLEQEWFIQKTGNKTGNKNANIYSFIPNDFITPLRSLSNWIDNWIEKMDNWIGTNKDNIKDIEIEKKLLVSGILKISSKLGHIFLTDDKRDYTEQLLWDKTYEKILKPLEILLSKEHKRYQLIIKCYKFAIEKNEFRYQNISDFESLYKALPKIVNNLLDSNKSN